MRNKLIKKLADISLKIHLYLTALDRQQTGKKDVLKMDITKSPKRTELNIFSREIMDSLSKNDRREAMRKYFYG